MSTRRLTRLHWRSVATFFTGTVALATVVALGGCSALDDDPGTTDRAVAAFYPLAWLTEEVAGPDWQVRNLTQPGEEPHDLTLDISQTADITRARLVVLESDFQPAVDLTVAENAPEAEIVDAAGLVELLPATGHEDEGEGDRDHGEFDPHFWLDPLLMADLGDELGARLGTLDPDHAEDYTERADRVRTELESVDEAYAAGLASCERETTVVSHDAFSYLERYGLYFESIAGLSPDAEPTPAALARLQKLIRAEGVTTVFSERLTSPKMSQSLARDLGIETAVLDPVEGLSDKTSDEDYVSLMRANLEALRTANSCS